MDYRRLTKQDAADYRELRLTALQTDADAFSTDFHEASSRPLSATAESLENQQAVTFGAFAEGRLVGVMTLLKLSGAKTRHRAEVLAVYTAEEARGKGVASSLLDTLLSHAADCSELEQLELAVNTANHLAIRLYERFGFKRIGTTPRAQKAQSRYIDELLMFKPLKE